MSEPMITFAEHTKILEDVKDEYESQFEEAHRLLDEEASRLQNEARGRMRKYQRLVNELRFLRAEKKLADRNFLSRQSEILNELFALDGGTTESAGSSMVGGMMPLAKAKRADVGDWIGAGWDGSGQAKMASKKVSKDEAHCCSSFEEEDGAENSCCPDDCCKGDQSE